MKNIVTYAHVELYFIICYIIIRALVHTSVCVSVTVSQTVSVHWTCAHWAGWPMDTLGRIVLSCCTDMGGAGCSGCAVSV